MKTIILVPGLNSLCPNLLSNRSLPRHPAGSPWESSSWTPSSCPRSPCPPATHHPPAHPSPTPQASWSFSLNHRSSSFISCSSLRGWFCWGPIPITQKSTVSCGRPYLSAAHGLAKRTERELGERRELSEGTGITEQESGNYQCSPIPSNPQARGSLPEQRGRAQPLGTDPNPPYPKPAQYLRRSQPNKGSTKQ